MAVAAVEALDRGRRRVVAPVVDHARLRRYRLGRLRAEMRRAGVDAVALTDPMSLQYAVDFEEYQLYQTRIATFQALIPLDGEVVMGGAYHRIWESVGEYAPCWNLSTFDAGLDLTAKARAFAEDTVRRIGRTARIAIDSPHIAVASALCEAGFDVVDARPLVDVARSVKSNDEIALLRHAIAVAAEGICAMRRVLVPGVTEWELIGELCRVNLAHGGRWMDGRMLASGPRTNPWLQEASDRVVEAGEIVSFDTDMVGPFGYFADVSRAMICGDRRPRPEQQDVLDRARAEIEHNMALLRPGMAFRDITDRSFDQPDRFIAHRYACLMHGAGMGDEWPKLPHRQDWERNGYEGEIEAGMVICVESFVGDEAGGEGVKLEQQVLVGPDSVEILSNLPMAFDEVGRPQG